MSNDQIITSINYTLNQINKLVLQAQRLLVQLSPVIPNPAPTPQPKPQPTSQSVVKFDIHCEKNDGNNSKLGVILTSSDFNILKQNDHVFTVIPVNPVSFIGTPNITIHDLNIWIKAESITKVPDVPANDV